MLVRHVSSILPAVMHLGQRYTYSHPQVIKGQTRILSLALV